jgi:hypothetical protein
MRLLLISLVMALLLILAACGDGAALQAAQDSAAFWQKTAWGLLIGGLVLGIILGGKGGPDA